MKQQLIIGMPSSGKSTFIGALRHVLFAKEVATDLELVSLSDEEDHLVRLENEWLDCQEIDRTKPSTEGWVEFHVRNRATGDTAILAVPDLRGETFERPLCAGNCPQELYEGVRDADGLLLFTNANRPDDGTLISDLADLVKTPGKPSADAVPFDPFKMPEEAKIVEFLQMANRRPLRSRRRRVAVVISAWDIVPDGIAPAAWFAARRPTLDQFLRNNDDLWDTRLYGASAQGGNYEKDRKRLSKVKKPSERVRLVGEDARIHDLSAPLSWLGAV